MQFDNELPSSFLFEIWKEYKESFELWVIMINYNTSDIYLTDNGSYIENNIITTPTMTNGIELYWGQGDIYKVLARKASDNEINQYLKLSKEFRQLNWCKIKI